jgi:WhiB family redox-sensing transcriptional regulator
MTAPNPGFTHPDAACTGVDPDLFFPEHGNSERDMAPALNICRQCPDPCREACLEHAITWREAGIWGGTTGRQRRTMRTNHNRTIPHNERPPSCADRCLAELRASGHTWITTRELCRRTGHAAATINTELGKQANAGVVERTDGPRRAAYWRIKAEAEVTV